ncbi:MAG TPA: baseplate J/gp47 family protein [Candidatus Limnocylindrales bacterium]|nr:baseplate J/gp47 family protein [Candidatus Limnocylindrales bacterium]
MASRVLYLDVDDEITSAANRIRTTEGSRVAVVLPYGSRVATSRINFRLLARDAQTNGKRLSVVAGDAATRALAASAGLPVFATVGEYESSLEDGAAARGQGDAAGAEPAAPEAPPPTSTSLRRRSARKPREEMPSLELIPDDSSMLATSATVVGATGIAGPGGADAGGTTRTALPSAGDADEAAPRARPEPRHPAAVPAARVVADTPTDEERRFASVGPWLAGQRVRPSAVRLPLVIGAAVVALALLVGGVAAYFLLPTATAVIAPRETIVGPVSLRITASPSATAPDPVQKVVPAQSVSVDVQASEHFPATGKRVEETEATGTVRFRNKDFTRSNSIPKGSVVSTQSGIRFRTQAAVTVPRAELVGLQIFPASANVKVTAVDAGPDGNVEPNTILVIPRGEDPLTLDVTNPDATAGGAREEFPRVTEEDVTAATTALTTQLQASFQDRLDDPDVAGGGATVFPATAALGAATFDVEPATLIGKEVDGFDLTGSATGTVLAVDEAPVRTVAEANIDASVKSGYTLVDGSGQVDASPALVEDGIITFPVVVTARQVLVVDPAAIKAEILGKSLPDAQTILSRYGTVELSVWPDWVGTIPTLDARVDVRTTTPLPIEAPSGSPSALREARP